MNRTLFAVTAAALLLSTGFGQASDIVPGSDTATRQAQTRDDAQVANGAFRSRTAGAQTDYGYPAQAAPRSRASDRADDRAVNRTAGAPTPARGGALVPGSDSF